MADYVEVTGVGRVDRTPDVLVARLGAEAASGAVGEALAAADAGFSAMVAAAVGAGVARRDVASAGLDVHPHHDHAGRQSGYLASMGLVLVLRDIGTAGAVVSADSTTFTGLMPAEAGGWACFCGHPPGERGRCPGALRAG